MPAQKSSCKQGINLTELARLYRLSRLTVYKYLKLLQQA